MLKGDFNNNMSVEEGEAPGQTIGHLFIPGEAERIDRSVHERGQEGKKSIREPMLIDLTRDNTGTGKGPSSSTLGFRKYNIKQSKGTGNDVEGEKKKLKERSRHQW